MTRVQVAARVAKRKEERPELFCPEPRCLWRTGDGGRCPRHQPTAQLQPCPSCGKRVTVEQWADFEGICVGCAEAIQELPA